MSENYVYRLVRAECSYGTQPNYLNVKQDHGIIYSICGEDGGKSLCPLMNANDHIPGENLTHFGRCKSPQNQVFGGDRQFHVGDLLDGIGKFFGGNEGYLCEPMTELAWKDTSDQNYIEGAPAITEESKLTCFYGGVITITFEENGDK